MKEISYHQNHEIIFPIIKEKFEYKIKTPHEGKVGNSNCTNSLHSLLHPFANLIIEDAAGTPPSDPFFLQVYITPLMPQRSDDPGTDNMRVNNGRLSAFVGRDTYIQDCSLVFVKRSTNQDAHLLARAPGFSYYYLCEHFLIQYVYSFVEKNTFKGKLT